jgi:hypothetical protein
MTKAERDLVRTIKRHAPRKALAKPARKKPPPALIRIANRFLRPSEPR